MPLLFIINKARQNKGEVPLQKALPLGQFWMQKLTLLTPNYCSPLSPPFAAPLGCAVLPSCIDHLSNLTWIQPSQNTPQKWQLQRMQHPLVHQLPPGDRPMPWVGDQNQRLTAHTCEGSQLLKAHLHLWCHQRRWSLSSLPGPLSILHPLLSWTHKCNQSIQGFNWTETILFSFWFCFVPLVFNRTIMTGRFVMSLSTSQRCNNQLIRCSLLF